MQLCRGRRHGAACLLCGGGGGGRRGRLAGRSGPSGHAVLAQHVNDRRPGRVLRRGRRARAVLALRLRQARRGGHAGRAPGAERRAGRAGSWESAAGRAGAASSRRDAPQCFWAAVRVCAVLSSA